MFGAKIHGKKHRLNDLASHEGILDISQLPLSVVEGLTPRGGWDASGGAYPVPNNVGDFWWITVAGTLGGVDYQINDWVVYVDDSPARWDKIDNTETGKVLASITDLTPDFLDGKTDGTSICVVAQKLAAKFGTVAGSVMEGFIKYTDLDARAAINNIFGSDGKADSDIDMDSHKLTSVTSVEGTATNAKVESSNDVILKSGDAAGVKGTSFRNNVGLDGTEIARMDTLGNLSLDGTVDGRDVIIDGVKLDGIDSGADVTGDNPPQAHTHTHASTTGQTASDHHAKYLDSEAVTAMGAKEDANSLNHDKYTPTFGTNAGEECEGNDARLSDNRNIKTYRQAAEPTLAADDDIAIWVDTDDSNKTYLVFRVAGGNQAKVVMT